MGDYSVVVTSPCTVRGLVARAHDTARPQSRAQMCADYAWWLGLAELRLTSGHAPIVRHARASSRLVRYSSGAEDFQHEVSSSVVFGAPQHPSMCGRGRAVDT